MNKKICRFFYFYVYFVLSEKVLNIFTCLFFSSLFFFYLWVKMVHEINGFSYSNRVLPTVLYVLDLIIFTYLMAANLVSNKRSDHNNSLVINIATTFSIASTTKIPKNGEKIIKKQNFIWLLYSHKMTRITADNYCVLNCSEI